MAEIVIDVGAQHHPPEESTLALAKLFHPRYLFAFDGWSGFENGIQWVGETLIVRSRRAVWTHDQGMPYRQWDMCSSVLHEGSAAKRVPTIDLAKFIHRLGMPVILKLDCEGAEYVLLPHLVAQGLDEMIELLMVEWHPPHLANGWYAPRPELRCKTVDWNDLTGLPTEAEKT